MSARVWVEAIELLGPGLPDWEAACAVLAGNQPYAPAPVELPVPLRLSPAERRRAIPSVRLALAVAEGAVAKSGHDPASLPAVFAASGADGETIGAVLAALTLPSREVSPTRFHNSVHNAASGYWSLAVGCRAPAASLSAYDASFAAGLLEAGVQAMCGGFPVLLVAYDLPYPEPLHAVRPIGACFGVALVLNPARTDRAIADLRLDMASARPATSCADAGLEQIRRGNPAARALPLLAAIAARATAAIHLDFAAAALEIGVAPC